MFQERLQFSERKTGIVPRKKPKVERRIMYFQHYISHHIKTKKSKRYKKNPNGTGNILEKVIFYNQKNYIIWGENWDIYDQICCRKVHIGRLRFVLALMLMVLNTSFILLFFQNSLKYMWMCFCLLCPSK